MNRDQRLLVERLRGHLVRHSNHGEHQTVRRPVRSTTPDRLILLDEELEQLVADDLDVPAAETTRRGPTAVG